jgi:hypothetical protein
MSEPFCTNYDRQGNGFSVQSVSPVAINMQDNISSISGQCNPPHNSNTLTLSASEILAIRKTLSDCPIPPFNPAIGAPTQLTILQMKENNIFPYIVSKGLSGNQGYPVGQSITKDMRTGESDALGSEEAPMGVAIPSGQNSSYWSDWGNDIFDGWGFFYIFDVATRQYFFPILNPRNLADGVFTTQHFNAFGRIYTITNGYPAQGIFKFDVSCNDNSQFIFGAYGDMGSDNDTINTNLTQSYTLNNTNYTLFYNRNIEDGDEIERLFSYFIPYEPQLNNTKTYSDFLINDDELSLYSVPVRRGITVYFSKRNDVKDWVLNDLTLT